MLKTIRKSFIITVLLILFTQIVLASNPNNGKQPQKITLKVALFPWIPDAAEDNFTSLKNRLEKEFEKQYPDIDLILRLQKDDNAYYNPPKVAGWLASGEYDLVEIDTIILGDLISSGTIETWETPKSGKDFFPAAVQGSTVKEGNEVSWWGMPHLLCGFFVISKSQEIDDAASIGSLKEAVQKAGKPLLGNFDSSWDLPSLYLDARVDNGMLPEQVTNAIKPPLDEMSASAIETFADLCGKYGKNPCIDGSYSEDDTFNNPVIEFVNGNAVAFWGYSERLHLTVKMHKEKGMPTDKILVNTTPLGSKSTPMLFVDSFVKRNGCSKDKECQKATVAFSEFINSEWAMSEVFLSQDAKAVGKDPVPRYLLPAKLNAFDIDGIKKDRLYQELKPFAYSGYAFPNKGEMFEKRRVLRWLLDEKLR